MASKKLFSLSIDYNRCDNCGICIFECGKDLFRYDLPRDRVVFHNAKDCVECFYCEVKCPEKAITLKLVAAH